MTFSTQKAQETENPGVTMPGLNLIYLWTSGEKKSFGGEEQRLPLMFHTLEISKGHKQIRN